MKLKTTPSRILGLYSTLFLVLFLAFSSCYEPIEGCLDAKATNFDFEADNDCDDCCSYPDIKISVEHLYEKTDFELDSIYENNLGQSFKVNAFKFAISQFAVRIADTWLSTADTIEVVCDEIGTSSSLKLSDVHTAINVQTSIITLDNFQSAGEYDQLRFTLGYENCIQSIDSTTIPEDAGIQQLKDDCYDTDLDKFISLQSEIVYAPDYTDTIDLVFYADELNVPYEFSISASNNPGINLSLDLTVEYSFIFRDVNFESSTVDELKSILGNNLASAILIN